MKERYDKWRRIQRQNFVDLSLLADFLELDPINRAILLKKNHFSLNLPLRLAKKMGKNQLSDPLFKQFVPIQAEMIDTPNFTKDPVGDQLAQRSQRLLHKYHGRALLLLSSACAMHCRYCFRQEYPYALNKEFQKELNLIKEDPSLHEIILSGGDPLALNDEQLISILDKLDKIEHIKIIRFHTRFMIGIPERLTDRLLQFLKSLRSQIVFAIHINHYLELDKDVLTSIKKLQTLGIPILTQTVLLKGVNDSVSVLNRLFLTLIQNGIIPYYLHQLDRVTGAAHFEVAENFGLKLMEELRKLLPGYALPTYVRESSGEKCKLPITSFQEYQALRSLGPALAHVQ